MNDETLKFVWPFDEARERDFYFYLEAIESYGEGAHVSVKGHGDMLMFGSTSYLGLNGHPRVVQAAQDAISRFGTGTCGTRLLAGTLTLHGDLEARIAKFKGTSAAVTFSSGYTANVATISSLLERGDTVICDKLDHASIRDGCTLSGIKPARFRHNDMDHLERSLTLADTRGKRLVVVDAVFSMDGDIINLPEVSRLCRKYGAWLMVDEAHSVGVLGKSGHGIEEHFNLPSDCVDIKMGTLSKTIPSVGGYIASSQKVCDFLRHQSGAFIYSGALPPSAAAAALAAFDVLESEPKRVQVLQDSTRYFRERLRAAGFSTHHSETPIFPIMCGSNELAWRFARFAQKRGLYLQAIPSPVVPEGTARLRAVTTANHTVQDLDFCLSILEEGARTVEGFQH
jgi:8-amino-7-oxononanoate synthase